MERIDPIDIRDIENSIELSNEEMVEVIGGRSSRADERKSAEPKTYHPSDFKAAHRDSKTSGITSDPLILSEI
jgi:hypothetical protein